MKISKVNHAKSGVSSKPITSGGMIYSYPSKHGKSDLVEHITKLNKKAQSLYSVFTPISETKYENVYKATVAIFNRIIVNPIKNGTDNDTILTKLNNASECIINYKMVLINKDKKRTTIERSDKLVDVADALRIKNLDDAVSAVVDGCIRNSLRKKVPLNGASYVITEGIRKIVYAVLAGYDYSRKISNIDMDELTAVINTIRTDYEKTEQIKKIADSIEKQNVPVQVGADGKHLVLSSSFNEKKTFIFNFLKDYAAASNDEQDNILRNIRYLLALYYFGDTDAELKGSSSWKLDDGLKDFDGPLSAELDDLVKSKENIPADDKKAIRAFNDKIKLEINNIVVSHYQTAVDNEGLSENDKCWLRFFSDSLSKKLNVNRINETKIQRYYLCKLAWEEWVSFIAKKYIEMGKGAYYFALSDIDKVGNEDNVVLGEISDKYVDGLSSFDYERIKAEDSLNRSLSGYISYAISNFDQSARCSEERNKVIKGDDGKDKSFEDILLLDEKDIVCRDNAKTRILRYFGGASSFEGTAIEAASNIDVIMALKKELYNVRNSSFHFISGEIKESNKELIGAIFDKEYASAGEIYRKRFFSNNVPRFYSEKAVNELMDSIYSKPKSNQAQIPSFNKILSRKKFPVYVDRLLTNAGKRNVANPDVSEIFRNSLYFVLKEIYYYDFIQLDDLGNRFERALIKAHKRAVEEESKDNKKKNMQAALADFKTNYQLLKEKGISFNEICQTIMTEYNQQNNQKKKKANAKLVRKTNKNKEVEEKVVKIEDESHIYQHYRELLYLGLVEAFIDYISEKNNERRYGVLKEPADRKESFDKMSEEKFVKSWMTNTFNHLKDGVIDDSDLSSWYIMAHFLDQKNLNHLIGAFKNYNQFVADIESRAKATGNKSYADYKKKVEHHNKIIDVLEFTKLYCGQLSNNIEDYFNDKEDYAKYIANFIDYEGEGSAYLQPFCEKVDEARYFDGMNPILNRNIVLSTLYGNESILKNSVSRIEEKHFSAFRNLREKLSGVFQVGGCKTEEEQIDLLRFQTSKNRLELVDILIFTELVNDLYGQLVSYSYIRERDMMFMQLGFYYVKLFYTDSVAADDKLRTIAAPANIGDGAILYQIVALYSYDLPFYKVDSNGKAQKSKANLAIGSKLKSFVNGYCDGKWDIYTNGLCFFEHVQGKNERHDSYVALRNYIDHFKYFANHKYSMMDLYSEIYNGFFSYDTKLKKSISYILPNILLSYFVKLNLDYRKVEKTDKDATYNRTQIAIGNIQSDYFTFKRSKIEVVKADDNMNESQVETFDIAKLMMAMNGNFVSKNKKEENKKEEKSGNKGAKTEKVPSEFILRARTDTFLKTVENMLNYKA